MNVYGYVQQRKKIKNAPKRVIVRDFWTTVSLADVSEDYETALCPFFDYEIKVPAGLTSTRMRLFY